MAIEFKSGPVLTGESARRFLEEMERVNNMPKKEVPEGFFDEIDRFIEQSKNYWRRKYEARGKRFKW